MAIPSVPPPPIPQAINSPATTPRQPTDRTDPHLLRFLAWSLSLLVVAVAGLVLRETWQNPQRRDAVIPIATGTRINLIHCPPEQLSLLPGIGPAMAQRIVEFREQYQRQTGKGLRDSEQLLAMPGIGKLTVERIKPWLTCDP